MTHRLGPIKCYYSRLEWTGSKGNEGVLHISQSFRIPGTSPSDCLVSYPGHSLAGYPSADVKSVYSTAPATWASFLGWSNYLNIGANVANFTRWDSFWVWISVWWSHKQETDSNPAPLTLCLHYPNSNLHMLCHRYRALFIDIANPHIYSHITNNGFQLLEFHKCQWWLTAKWIKEDIFSRLNIFVKIFYCLSCNVNSHLPRVFLNACSLLKYV